MKKCKPRRLCFLCGKWFRDLKSHAYRMHKGERAILRANLPIMIGYALGPWFDPP